MRVIPNAWTLPRSVAAAVVILIAGALTAQASSHREAPFITELPKVDGTDFYMFRSYEPGRDGFVTLIADYLPLQDPYGGPNYFFLDPDARYEIHIDNDGDAKPDITFQFRFQNALINDNGRQGKHLDIGGVPVAIPLVNFGPISAGDSSNLNLIETYTVNVLRSNRRGRAGHSQDVTNNADGAATFSSNRSTTSGTSRFRTIPRTRPRTCTPTLRFRAATPARSSSSDSARIPSS